MAGQRTLTPRTRSAWRKWLETNHDTATEVWVTYYKKHTGKPTVGYDAAVEEAICFGWIDGQVRTIDDERYRQRYTPRTEKSKWSEPNKKRANRMIREGLMTPAGMAKIREAKKDGRWENPQPNVRTCKMPEDLRTALERNKRAFGNWQKFSPSCKMQYIYWVDEAKREETRTRRIRETVKRSAVNKKAGIP